MAKKIKKSVPEASTGGNNVVAGFLVFTLVLIIALAVGIVYFLKGSSSVSNIDNTLTGSLTSNVSDESDKQVITLAAKGGFTPELTVAKADKASVLKLDTKNTFDCSSTLSIPALGVQKNLPSTGSTIIDIPAQKAGTKLAGTCSMGMYSFSVTFVQ
jgi:hypothetical protein